MYDDSDEEENNPPEPGQQIATTDSPTQRLNEEDAKPIETKSEFTEKEEAQPKKDMTRSIHVNPINARQVIRAAGSRKGQKDQKAVMGFSPSYVSPYLIYKPRTGDWISFYRSLQTRFSVGHGGYTLKTIGKCLMVFTSPK